MDKIDSDMTLDKVKNDVIRNVDNEILKDVTKMGDVIRDEFRTCNEMDTDKINERLEDIEGSASSLKNDATNMEQNNKTGNLETKVKSLKTVVTNLKQNIRTTIKDELKRSRIPKVLNNALKLIENSQSVTLKLYTQGMKESVDISDHIHDMHEGYEGKKVHC